ncbi:hypothetical protein ACYZTX_28970 [Pseudomonas sp. MDT1-17]
MSSPQERNLDVQSQQAFAPLVDDRSTQQTGLGQGDVLSSFQSGNKR